MPRLALLVFVAMLGVPAGAAAEWKELRTPDFLFIGDAPDGAIRSTAQNARAVSRRARAAPSGRHAGPRS